MCVCGGGGGERGERGQLNLSIGNYHDSISVEALFLLLNMTCGDSTNKLNDCVIEGGET